MVFQPRLLGTDRPQINSAEIDTPLTTPNTRTGDAAGELALARTREAAQFGMDSLNNNASLLSEISNNRATAQAATLEATARMELSGGGGGGFAGDLLALGQGLGDLYGVYAEIKAQEEERRLAEQERLRQEALAEATQRINELRAASSNIILGEDGGQQRYVGLGRDILREYQDVLAPEDLIELSTRYLQPAEGLIEFQARERIDNLQALEEQQREVVVQQSTFRLSFLAGQIEYAPDSQTMETNINQYMTDLTSLLENHSPETQLAILTNAYSELTQRASNGNARLLETALNVHNMQIAATEASSLYIEWQSGNITDHEYLTHLGMLEHEYGLPTNSNITDPFAPIRLRQEARNLQQSIEDAHRYNVDARIEGLTIDEAGIAAISYDIFMSGGSTASVWEQTLGDNPYLDTAIGYSDMLTQWETLTQDYAERDVERQLTINQLSTMTVDEAAQWLEQDIRLSEDVEEFQTDVYNEQASQVDAQQRQQQQQQQQGSGGIGQQFNDSMRSIIERYVALETGGSAGAASNAGRTPRAVAGTSPEDAAAISAQREALRQEWINARDERIQILQNQAQVEQQEIEMLEARLGRAGFDLSDGITSLNAQNEAMRTGLDTLRGQITQAQEEARLTTQTAGGITPPFDPPQLLEFDVGASEPLRLPFHPDAAVIGVETYNYGEDRGGRQHAGEDIGVPAGTPLVFYDFGEVVKIEYDETPGYGHYVDIRTPDGLIHRFAHLESTPSVAVGSRVSPGQVFAYTGDSGSPGSFHLHWEVRHASDYGYAGTIDPFEHMLTNYSQSGRQSRSNGQQTPSATTGDSSVPVIGQFAAATIDDYQVGVRNNRNAHFGYEVLQQDNSFRVRLHEISEELGIPTVWLADIMAHESAGFQAGINNGFGEGYVGLIQFGPEARQDLGVTIADLQDMSRTEQLDLVYEYLRPFVPFRSVYEVLMSIWGGWGGIDALRSGDDVSNWSDTWIEFDDYVDRLGANVGRRYQPYDPTRIVSHSRYHANCATCEQQMRQNGTVYFHEAIA